jgi:hypothetical protein
MMLEARKETRATCPLSVFDWQSSHRAPPSLSYSSKRAFCAAVCGPSALQLWVLNRG